jgi:hypothetical protein
MSDTCSYDRRGNYFGGGNTLMTTPSQLGGDLRPISRPRAKTYEAVSSWQRREMVDVSRVIAAGVQNIRTALLQAGEYSVGDSWHIKYRGKNKAWGKKRDESFNGIFFRDCNQRGRQSDWWATLRQLNWTRKVQADYGILFDGQPSTDPVTGKKTDPSGQFQVITFDRISTSIIGGSQPGVVGLGNGLDRLKELPKVQGYAYGTSIYGYASWPGIYIINDKSSQFDGYRIIDGIIVDANMRRVGFRVTGFTEAGQPTYVDVPAAMMHFNFSTREQTDLIRGIPEIGYKIIPTMHLDDVQQLITMAMKLASALAVTRESSDGTPASSGRQSYNEESTDAAGNVTYWKRSVQEIYPGLFELAVNNKESLKTLGFDRPSMNEENFIARIETSILHDLWPRSLIYSGDTGRAATRVTAAQANTICTWDQRCLERDARWICDRRTEYEMRAGYIPYNDNLADPYEYVFTVPGKFTVDEGNDNKMRLASLGRCTISRGMICELDGYLAEEIEEQRFNEEDRLMGLAEKLGGPTGKYKWISEKEALLRLDTGESQVSFSDQSRGELVGDTTTPPPGTAKPETKPTTKPKETTK